MPRYKDITGQRFGRLTALRPTEQRRQESVEWECRCDCGKSVLRLSSNLVKGRTKSCGCESHPIKDITNQRFGKLIALRHTNQRHGSSVVWECQCDCGNVTFLPGIFLTTGRTKNCGCDQIKDITGQRFGKLTILRRTDQQGRKSALWECQCDCGKIVLRRTSDLTWGHYTSCGCKRYGMKDITGQRFGRLTVLRPTEQRRGESVVWECQCDCGNIIQTVGNNLRNGNTKSCGCWKKEKFAKVVQETVAKTCIEGTKINALCQGLRINNTSGVVGVTYDTTRGLWIAQIMFKEQRYYLGTYKNKEEAIIDRKKAEDALHVKFLELYQQGLISPDSPGFSDEAIVFDYEQVLSRYKYPDRSSQQQGIKRSAEKPSKYVGVFFQKDRSRWRAAIAKNGVRINLGTYSTEELAAEAYDEKAKELYGKHARLNFPAEKEKE